VSDQPSGAPDREPSSGADPGEERALPTFEAASSGDALPPGGTASPTAEAYSLLARRKIPLLFLTVLVIATAGLIYELIAGTLASYVLGDSVFQFSTIIGVYLSAMGLGAYLSRFVRDRLAERFVDVELAAAFVGGASAPFLYLAFAHAGSFRVLLYGTVVLIGVLVGIELPLLMRILEKELDFKELVAKVLTFDYLGALIGSLLFAIVLMPTLGLVRTSLLLGLANCGVGLMTTWVLGDLIYRPIRWRLRLKGGLVAAILATGLVLSDELTSFAEGELFADPVVFAEQTPYQRIVLTQGTLGVSLFLNGNLQFASADEYRYHEALVHPAFAAASQHRRVLVLGGGDGLAVREILRHPGVEEVTLVDLDPAMTNMASRVPVMRELNADALADPRVRIVNDDAMVWLDEGDRGQFDVVIIDFPDPNNFSLGKLYTSRFYGLLRGVMHEGTAVVVQATSPLFARRSFWCIERTMAASGLYTAPFHAFVPSFGEWGYVLAMTRPFDRPEQAPDVTGLRYLDDATLRSLFVFSADMQRPDDIGVNRLNTQLLVQYYEEEWSRWQHH
jgi:spermidine synthase